MPATLRLREQDQTAELHELLSRLQTSKVDEFGEMLIQRLKKKNLGQFDLVLNAEDQTHNSKSCEDCVWVCCICKKSDLKPHFDK